MAKKRVPRDINSFNENDIDLLLNNALKRLCKLDKVLFKNNANERSLCHRLAVYLEIQFYDFDIDCEYNRHYREKDFCKRLRGEDLLKLAGRKPEIDDDDSVTVFPDIIVHRRNTDDNLLVIETKKSTSVIADDYDMEKLRAYRTELGYRFGIFLKFGTKSKEKPIVENRFVS